MLIIPAYRGSMRFGAAHHHAIDYGGKELDDVASAVDYLRTLGTVDPDRIGIPGHSHGGLITALLLFRGQTPFRVGVASAPVTNLVDRLSSSGPAYQRQFATQAGIGGLPFERRDEYLRRSPSSSVDSLRVPLYVYVATNDTDVTFEESRPPIDALQARKPGVAETKVYVPARGHARAGRRVGAHVGALRAHAPPGHAARCCARPVSRRGAPRDAARAVTVSMEPQSIAGIAGLAGTRIPCPTLGPRQHPRLGKARHAGALTHRGARHVMRCGRTT